MPYERSSAPRAGAGSMLPVEAVIACVTASGAGPPSGPTTLAVEAASGATRPGTGAVPLRAVAGGESVVRRCTVPSDIVNVLFPGAGTVVPGFGLSGER